MDLSTTWRSCSLIHRYIVICLVVCASCFDLVKKMVYSFMTCFPYGHGVRKIEHPSLHVDVIAPHSENAHPQLLLTPIASMRLLRKYWGHSLLKLWGKRHVKWWIIVLVWLFLAETVSFHWGKQCHLLSLSSGLVLDWYRSEFACFLIYWCNVCPCNVSRAMYVTAVLLFVGVFNVSLSYL